MQRFAKTIRQDLEAVRNAMSEPWSNGQTEGQINRLKTLMNFTALQPATQKMLTRRSDRELP